MSSFTTPARIRWARSNVSGQVPNTLAPGSMAVNWPDKKVFVGDAGAQALQFSQWLDDFNTAIIYKTGDFAIFGDDIWRCTQNTSVGLPFDITQWQKLTDSQTSQINERASSNVISGGEAALVNSTTVSVTAGTGVIIYYESGVDDQPLITVVEWGDFTVTVAPINVGDTYVLLSIDENGSVLLARNPGPNPRRKRVDLATVFFVGTDAVSIDDASAQTARISEAVWDQYLINGGAYKILDATLRNGTAPLSLSLDEGRYFAIGRTWRTQPTSPNLSGNEFIDPLPMTRMTQVGDPTVAPVTDVDPNNYDVGGVVTPVPAGNWTIQYIFTKPGAVEFFIQYGQALYASLEEAANEIREDYGAYTPYFDLEGYANVGALIVQQGTVDLSAALVVDTIGPGSNPFQPVSLAVAGDYYLLDGSRPLTGDMDAAGFTIDDAVIDGGQMV